MRVVVKTLALLALAVLLPSAVLAQAVIAGTIKDSSGAVLPGVSVEVASPALIEKVRSAVTDGTGQYRVEDLRPGIYTVTFTLQGFNSFRREGVELTGQFTATINGELKVGAVSETVTVTGESPVVDIQSARREMTLNNDVLKAIPTARSYGAIVSVVPGVNTNLNDVVTGTATTQFPIHGGRNNEGRLTIDGLNIGNPPGGNQPASYVADVGNAQEVTFTTAGGLGESETAGLVMNVVPKTGGNSTTGSVSFSGTGEKLQSDNYTPELKAQGLTSPIPLTKAYDLNGAFGGPLKKDRIWYFVNARTQGGTRLIANVYYNQNAGDASKWLYLPDTTRQAYNDRSSENVSLRVTWQATPRNKIGGFWDEQANCRTCTGLTTGITDPPRVAPEARGSGQTKPLRVPQVTWSSPVTNKLLLDAGFGGIYYGWGNFERDPNPTHDLIAVTEQCAGPITATNKTGCDANGGIPGLVYRSQDYGNNQAGAYSWRASASYVTGRQSLKVGYQGTYLSDIRTWSDNTQNLAYRFNNGIPNQITEYISPWVNNGLGAWHAIFVGSVDRWASDVTGSAPVRPFLQLVPGTDGRAVSIPSDGARDSGDAGRQRVQRHHAENGPGVRRLRQRQNRLQGQHGKVPRGHGDFQQLGQREPHLADASNDGGLRAVGRHAYLDGRQQQLLPGLQPAEHRLPGSSECGWGFLRSRVERALRHADVYQQL